VRKSTLYGGRVQGDLELGLEPSRIDPGGDKRWAELFSPGGRIPGQPAQDILEQTDDMNYRIGTRRLVDDRVFRYCHSKEALESQNGAFIDRDNYYEGNGAMGTAVIGATEVEFDNQAAQPIAEDELADGWLVSATTDPTDALHILCMRIKSNKQSDGVGGTTPTCTLTLYRGMAKALLGATHRAYVYPNLYKNVENHGGATFNTCLGTVICVPLRYIDANKYFWGLTWGIYCPVSGTDCNVIDNTNQRVFGFDGFGRIQYLDTKTAADRYYQPGGYFLFDGSHATQGDQLAMLQLQP